MWANEVYFSTWAYLQFTLFFSRCGSPWISSVTNSRYNVVIWIFQTYELLSRPSSLAFDVDATLPSQWPGWSLWDKWWRAQRKLCLLTTGTVMGDNRKSYTGVRISVCLFEQVDEMWPNFLYFQKTYHRISLLAIEGFSHDREKWPKEKTCIISFDLSTVLEPIYCPSCYWFFGCYTNETECLIFPIPVFTPPLV